MPPFRFVCSLEMNKDGTRLIGLGCLRQQPRPCVGCGGPYSADLRSYNLTGDAGGGLGSSACAGGVEPLFKNCACVTYVTTTARVAVVFDLEIQSILLSYCTTKARESLKIW